MKDLIFVLTLCLTFIAGCEKEEPEEIPAPTDVRTSVNLTPYGYPQIRVEWNDNSSDEDGFIILYRRENWNRNHWEEWQRVAANETSYYNPYRYFAVYPGGYFIFAVAAIRGGETSPYASSRIFLPSPTNVGL